MNFIVYIVGVLVLIEGRNVSALPVEMPSQNSLYNSSDYVTILTVDNFYDTLVGQQNAWLVQFYSSYCGHCIAFAPLFKQIVKNISGEY